MGTENINFGEILHSLRVYKGIEIKELAQGVCSEEDLIEIEKNKKYPALDQIYKLAEKLNVEVSDFFDFASAGSVNYVSAVFDLIEKYKRDRNYSAIHDIVLQEKENPIFSHPSSKQFLLWHEAISEYYLEGDSKGNKDEVIKKLYEAIEITNPSRKGLTEREIEILVAIALIEKDASNFEESINLLKEALEDMDNLPSMSVPRVRLRALFGLSQALSGLERFEESLTYSQKGISQCINDEVMYLFGEFFYQTGFNFLSLGKMKEGKENLGKSLQVFEIQNHSKYVDFIKQEMEKVILL
ncbi:helix-turn-helix domain-containing protein [Neobacillus terrae]|uniref:helix-turn-helix domain-containing protein n=1 Tax=Neobacillus terrae TaxID=3034837 RepID=UPI001408FAD1|nr:helix-turn-helix transcriptional regulator [Neobacillus terrae]NHM29490.1 helix-turn-helix transcriptional regulator [Neobacillus terrae]